LGFPNLTGVEKRNQLVFHSGEGLGGGTLTDQRKKTVRKGDARIVLSKMVPLMGITRD